MAKIIVTQSDHQQLTDMIRELRRQRTDEWHYIDALEHELSRAKVVPDEEVPADVVTMNATVRVRTKPSRVGSQQWTLVYPEQADFDNNRLSILAPLGTALLGYRVGDTVTWQMPAGPRKIEIEKIVSRPRATATARE